ncbi:PREDICTED: uncharacterized protein LOC106099931 [Papilio polytes]|uniref:uncharacterized protein LOC106099931 n=1 Tax=Papilio polytes TaxID=76194 RepID=UPI00067637EB|nr:PREDICTED: uncharacterized protein LOC106099931 [Papilio polytes]
MRATQAVETALQTGVETMLETVPETAEDTVPETAEVTVLETAPETSAKTGSETAADTAVETVEEIAMEIEIGGGEKCACYAPSAPPATPRLPALCLQFTRVPVGTVQWRQVALHNAGALPLRWSAHVRRWPHARALSQLHGHCSEEVDAEAAGVRVQCLPAGGVLVAGGTSHLALGVHAHTWGLYRDQLLLQTEQMAPLVLDVWAEVVGAPLQFALRPCCQSASQLGSHPASQPASQLSGQSTEPPVLWMSRSDPARRLVLDNTARCGLRVRTLLLKDHECARDALPLRLYMRFYDVQRQEIPLRGHKGFIMAFHEDSLCQDLSEDYIGTGIELIISDDYGLQVETIFEVICVLNV